MRNFNLIPFEGTDSIKLGMTSGEITNCTNIIPTQVKKREDFEFMFVDYNKDGKSIAFEFYYLEDCCQVYFNHTPLLGQPYRDIRELFRKWDKDLRYEEGFISFKYMIAASYGEEDLVTGVLIATKNYYDEFGMEDFDTEDMFDKRFE